MIYTREPFPNVSKPKHSPGCKTTCTYIVMPWSSRDIKHLYQVHVQMPRLLSTDVSDIELSGRIEIAPMCTFLVNSGSASGNITYKIE